MVLEDGTWRNKRFFKKQEIPPFSPINSTTTNINNFALLTREQAVEQLSLSVPAEQLDKMNTDTLNTIIMANNFNKQITKESLHRRGEGRMQLWYNKYAHPQEEGVNLWETTAATQHTTISTTIRDEAKLEHDLFPLPITKHQYCSHYGPVKDSVLKRLKLIKHNAYFF